MRRYCIFLLNRKQGFSGPSHYQTIPLLEEEWSSGKGISHPACRKFSAKVPLLITRPSHLILQGNCSRFWAQAKKNLQATWQLKEPCSPLSLYFYICHFSFSLLLINNSEKQRRLEPWLVNVVDKYIRRLVPRHLQGHCFIFVGQQCVLWGFAINWLWFCS